MRRWLRDDDIAPWSPVQDGRDWDLRARLVDLLEQTSTIADEELAAAAAQLLADYRSIWVRERRWRNNDAPDPVLVHVAGEVIACREYRRSCPGYIVDRRQTCQHCGAELVHGRWGMFFEPGAAVAQLGTIKFTPRGDLRERPCTSGEDT
jgi:hypothetical protein